MKTSSIRQSEPGWQIIDAKGKALGRLATQAADLLRGKSKPSFVANMDCGDHVVIINAKDIVLTGNKLEDKAYYHYSGYPGGIKSKSAKELMENGQVDEIITHAVKGMLPKNKLQPEWLKRLHIYLDNNHPHQGNVAHLTAK